MADCLVYFFTGFLDGGKTTTICSWASEEAFADKKILILSTEEGEEEYEEKSFTGKMPDVVFAETDDINKEFMFDLERRYKPDVIFMEWNGSVSPAEFFEKVDVPRRWMLAAAIVIVDASTYSEYYRNMQTIFADYYRYCDNVIFNRVDPEVNNIPKLRGSVKSLNPAMNISFIGEDNEMIDIGEHLPYDLSKDPCVVDPDDFGLFYTDALDNVERYNGKRVTLTGRAVIFREFRGRAFALQRRAYTCCADDIRPINILCFHEHGSGFPAGQWLKVTGRIRYFEEDNNGQKIAVPCITVDDYAVTSAPENEIIYFS